MTLFFTSDSHFNHEGIIAHCKRPFSCVEEMDEVMVRNWNAVVRPTDTVYHLGDFSWQRKKSDIEATLSRLNGIKHLIVGNHDHTDTRRAKGWASVAYAARLKNNGLKVYLSHYPVLGFREDIHFHGHQHNPTPWPVRHQVDVGVDAWGFKPVSIEQILASSECFLRTRKEKAA